MGVGVDDGSGGGGSGGGFKRIVQATLNLKIKFDFCCFVSVFQS